MRNSSTESTNSKSSSQSSLRVISVVLILAVAGMTGILAGNWIANARKAPKGLAQLDEYVGIGKRTGLTGDLELAISPVHLTTSVGDPVHVLLKLTNASREPMVLNDWFAPSPAELHSNQFPFKVMVRKDNRDIICQDTMTIRPPHTNKDFFTLSPGQSKDIPMDITRGFGKGWDMSRPGHYTVEIWYETYLTGKYIGVNAWTGMTNHVVLQVTVRRR